MNEAITIDRMSYGSAAIGSLSNGKTIFVEGGAPGDRARVSIDEDKGSYARGHIEELLEPSPLREAKPQCAMPCGGCSWCHLSYESQLRSKRANVVDALKRTAHMDEARAEELVHDCLPSKRQWGYRNKIELAARLDDNGQLQVGFNRQGTHELVTPSSCPVAHTAIQKAPRALRGALRFVQGSRDLGIYRIGVRTSVRTHDTEIALWTPSGAFPRHEAAKTLGDCLKATSIVRVMANPGKARAIKGIEALGGKGCWEEKLLDCTFLTSAPSFFQVNTAQAEKLIRCVLDGLEIDEGSYVADLYSGGGTFSIPLAAAGADVVAVESSGSSVRDLRRNAEINNVYVEVIGGDAARELPTLGNLDALVVDPPRAGLAKGVVEDIAKSAPKRVAYVSCDAATWARDTQRFEANGYRLKSAQPIDLFPQTFHCEVASIFERVSK